MGQVMPNKIQRFQALHSISLKNKPFKLQSFQPLQSDWKNRLFKLQALELSSSAINQTEKQTFEIQSFQALQ
jgi:hypothetical protein